MYINRSLLEKSAFVSLVAHGAVILFLFRFTVRHDFVQPEEKIIRARIVWESPLIERAVRGHNEDGKTDAEETKGKMGMPKTWKRDEKKYIKQKTSKHKSSMDIKVRSGPVAYPIESPIIKESQATSQNIDSRQKTDIEMKRERLPDFNSLNIPLYKQGGNKSDEQNKRHAQKRNPSEIMPEETGGDDSANMVMYNADGEERNNPHGYDEGTYGKSESGTGIGLVGDNGDGAKRCPDEMVLIPEHDDLSSFCIDRFEYPNVRGSKSQFGVSFLAAGRFCASSGKRLCYEDEWTEACRGVSRTAFPYGNKHVKDKCNTDGNSVLSVGGEYGECVSDYHIYDLTGNLWEWVIEKRTGNGVLRGGSFMDPGVSGCSTRTIGENVKINIGSAGFRCCL
jgi:hypothetical protein